MPNIYLDRNAFEIINKKKKEMIKDGINADCSDVIRALNYDHKR